MQRGSLSPSFALDQRDWLLKRRTF